MMKRGNGFDSEYGYACDYDHGYDDGVDAVKERAMEIARELKAAMAQDIPEKEEEAERD